MVSSLAYERRDLMEAYYKFRFAFPERSSELIEVALEREREVLRAVLEGKSAYEIRHPYPVSLADLYAETESYCR
jgi:hypothetical protein